MIETMGDSIYLGANWVLTAQPNGVFTLGYNDINAVHSNVQVWNPPAIRQALSGL